MLRILSFIILCAFSINLSVAAVPKETIKRIEQEAQKGDIKAQVMLGIGYYLGNELKQDYGKAKKWLTMASNKGNSDAQLFLGDMYLNGNGVEANLETAMDIV
ncbi:tetratricopeptide repeat protein [Providencia hangzhouensis]|uniref:tetratricopeptide repeat protein n=1 Tax=Providencia hangzhouensis TaxID=3031799 RepID=UPI0034DD6A01